MNNPKILQMIITQLGVCQIYTRCRFQDNWKNRLTGGNYSIHPEFVVPIRGRNIEFRRALRNGSISSIRPPCRVLPLYTMFLTSHRQRNANSTWKSVSVSMRVSQWSPRTHTHACVRESWQLCREISYEITGSHCHKPRVPSPLLLPLPPFPLSTSARSIINL